MKISKFFLLLILVTKYIFAGTSIQTAFMTPRDRLGDTSANISLRNDSNSAKTVYGLYVRQYAYVASGDSCDHATVIYPAGSNINAGTMVTPVAINANKSAAVGGNYLYNMIYNAIFYENIIIFASPPGCALPGCTWGSDSTIYNWCIYLGALAPVSTSGGYTSNVPPLANLASSTGNYNYNLTSSYHYLGPISCNDQTLTCTVASQQTQSFS